MVNDHHPARRTGQVNEVDAKQSARQTVWPLAHATAIDRYLPQQS